MLEGFDKTVKEAQVFRAMLKFPEEKTEKLRAGISHN